MYRDCSLEGLSVKVTDSRGLTREYCVKHFRRVTGSVLTLHMCVDVTGMLILSVRYSDLPHCFAPDSQVRMATVYWLDGQGIESLKGRDFPHPSRPDLSPLSLL